MATGMEMRMEMEMEMDMVMGMETEMCPAVDVLGKDRIRDMSNKEEVREEGCIQMPSHAGVVKTGSMIVDIMVPITVFRKLLVIIDDNH